MEFNDKTADGRTIQKGHWRFRKLRHQIMKENKWLCQYCKEKGHLTPATEIDHKIPFAIAQEHDPSNLIPVCKKCHAEKSRKEKIQTDIGRFNKSVRKKKTERFCVHGTMISKYKCEDCEWEKSNGG